jgi:hypothetical protein
VGRDPRAGEGLLQIAALDWAELQVEALATPRTPDAQQRLARRKADVHAQLMNLQSVAASQGPAIAEAFWAEAQAVLGAAVGLAFLAVCRGDACVGGLWEAG